VSESAPLKPIRLSKHALGYTASRGFAVVEVEEAIRTCPWGAAELGRLDCRKDFPYGMDWNGKVYATRQIRPVFVDEAAEIALRAGRRPSFTPLATSTSYTPHQRGYSAP
jgi:hypothetical protein